MRVGIVSLLLCALVVLMQCAYAQQFHFSHGWKPGKRMTFGDEGHAGHQIFRLKKGYHFFRLKKESPGECAIGEEARTLLADVVKAAQSGALCPSDKRFIAAFVQSL